MEEKNSTKWVRDSKEKFQKSFLITDILCYEDYLNLKLYQANKIIPLTKKKNILNVTFKDKILKNEFGKYINKIELHMIKASNHTSLSPDHI